MLKIINITLIFGYLSVISASILDVPVQNEQQRQLYEKLQNVDTTIPSSEKIIPEPTLSKDKNDTVCFVSNSIIVKNMTLLSEGEQKEIIDPFVGQCNGIHSLSLLANKLTKYYIDHGYITSRVYLTPQDISDGEVELYAIEGKIARISSDNTKTNGAFIGLENEVLDLKDLESSIEQVNRLRSNKTTMDLVPSDKQGLTDVILHSQETLPLFGSFGVNNYGSEATGKFQIYGEFTWENALGISDILSINLNTTDKQENSKNSFGNSFVYSVPLGKWLWESGFSHFAYTQTIYSLNDSFVSHGESDVYWLGTAYKLFHDSVQNIEVTAQAARKKNISKIEGVVIEPSTYNLSIGKVGSKYVFQQPTWEAYFLLDYYRGLNILNPTQNGALKHDFSKWTLAIGATKYFNAGFPIVYQFSGYAQHANDLLYGVEQISIGGSYSVRGFQTKNISGGDGGYIRNDIAFQISTNISPYVAHDIGHIRSDEDTAGGTLSSATMGIRTHYLAFKFDLYHAVLISSPDKTFGTNPFVGISMSANF